MTTRCNQALAKQSNKSKLGSQRRKKIGIHFLQTVFVLSAKLIRIDGTTDTWNRFERVHLQNRKKRDGKLYHSLYHLVCLFYILLRLNCFIGIMKLV